MINWKIRIKNKSFWMVMIPAVLLLIEQLAALLGYTLSLDDIGSKLLDAIKTTFLLLGILGIVNDPTTPGLQDSPRALSYTRPGYAAENEEQ